MSKLHIKLWERDPLDKIGRQDLLQHAFVNWSFLPILSAKKIYDLPDHADGVHALREAHPGQVCPDGAGKAMASKLCPVHWMWIFSQWKMFFKRRENILQRRLLQVKNSYICPMRHLSYGLLSSYKFPTFTVALYKC